VRDLSSTRVHYPMLPILTVYLSLFCRPRVPKQHTQKGPEAPAEAVTKPKAVPTKRRKTRKGPARLSKKKVTVMDLDAEMDAYRASVPQIGGDPNRMVFT
jgi:hypothetical protein